MVTSLLFGFPDKVLVLIARDLRDKGRIKEMGNLLQTAPRQRLSRNVGSSKNIMMFSSNSLGHLLGAGT